MKYLGRNEILSAADLIYEDIDVPEWGGLVRICSLSGADRDAWEMSLMKHPGESKEVDLQNMRARLVAKSVVDETGKRIFSDTDVIGLGKKSARALMRVFDAAVKLNAVSEADIEEIEKNSVSGQSNDSGTD